MKRMEVSSKWNLQFNGNFHFILLEEAFPLGVRMMLVSSFSFHFVVYDNNSHTRTLHSPNPNNTSLLL